MQIHEAKDPVKLERNAGRGYVGLVLGGSVEGRSKLEAQSGGYRAQDVDRRLASSELKEPPGVFREVHDVVVFVDQSRRRSIPFEKREMQVGQNLGSTL